MSTRKIRVVVAKPGLRPEGGSAPLPDLPPEMARAQPALESQL
jgi:hypothetical protein